MLKYGLSNQHFAEIGKIRPKGLLWNLKENMGQWSWIMSICILGFIQWDICLQWICFCVHTIETNKTLFRYFVEDVNTWVRGYTHRILSDWEATPAPSYPPPPHMLIPHEYPPTPISTSKQTIHAPNTLISNSHDIQYWLKCA